MKLELPRLPGQVEEAHCAIMGYQIANAAILPVKDK